MENLSNLVIYRYIYTHRQHHAYFVAVFFYLFLVLGFFWGGWIKELYAQRGNTHFLCERNAVITSCFVREFPGALK